MPSEDLPEFELLGIRLKEMRERRGLSQEELSSLAGVSQAAISLVEKGRRLPSVENLVKLAVALKVTTDFLVGMAGAGEDGGGVNAFFRHAGEVSAEDKRLALDIIGVIRKGRKRS